MRNGKMKTLHGLYKTLGRDLFLELAKNYSDHVHDTIDATLDEMECRWFDAAHTMTEADKMVEDYPIPVFRVGTPMPSGAICPSQTPPACIALTVPHPCPDRPAWSA